MKILVLQLKRIGDLILTTPALWALRENLPDAHITLAVEAGCRELLPAIDYVDETLIYERGGKRWPLLRKLLFQHFDVCLDFTETDRSALFAVLSKAPQRVAFERIQRSRGKAIFYNSFVNSSVRENHTVDHYLNMLRALGIEPRPTPVTLHLPDWTEKKARQLLSETGLDGPDTPDVPFVLVHPGTARPEKYWLPERWAEAMAFCERELGLPCVLSGSNDRSEQEHLGKIKTALARLRPPQTACDLSGRLDLLTLAALTKIARLVLSVDSAPMHLAAAFQTPQIALFGPTNPFHWQPRQANAVVLLASAPEANPPLEPRHQSAPMREIVAERVINAITSLFSAPRSAPVVLKSTDNGIEVKEAEKK